MARSDSHHMWTHSPRRVWRQQVSFALPSRMTAEAHQAVEIASYQSTRRLGSRLVSRSTVASVDGPAT